MPLASIAMAPWGLLTFDVSPPSSVLVATVFSCTVRLRRRGNTLALTSGVPVKVLIASGSGTLGGTINQVTDANGSVTFSDLTLDVASVVALNFSAPGFQTLVHSITVSAVGGGALPLTKFYNSREPGGNALGSIDTGIIFIDDFDRGAWYALDADHIPGGSTPGTTTIGEAGWFGTIFPQSGINNPTLNNACDANFKGIGGKKYCGTYGFQSQIGSNYMASHEFSAGNGSGTPALYTELFARWYYRADPGFQWGGHKHVNFTKFAGDIAWHNWQLNCGNGPAATATPKIQIIHGENVCSALSPNVDLTSGIWWCFHERLKLNSSGTVADGIIQAYITNCGADGLHPVDDVGSPVSAPILRYNRSNVAFDRNQAGGQSSPMQVEVIWFESWSNPASVGSSYLDGICVRKDRLPGFYGSP